MASWSDAVSGIAELAGQMLHSLCGDSTLAVSALREALRAEAALQFALVQRDVAAGQHPGSESRTLARIDRASLEYTRALTSSEAVLSNALADADFVTLERDVRGIGNRQAFSLRDVLLLGERLARMSVSPSDWTEKQGRSYAQRPVPSDTVLQTSRLHLTLDALLAGAGRHLPPENPVEVAEAPAVVVEAAATPGGTADEQAHAAVAASFSQSVHAGQLAALHSGSAAPNATVDVDLDLGDDDDASSDSDSDH